MAERLVDRATVERLAAVLSEQADRDDARARRTQTARLLWATVGAAAALVAVLAILVVVFVFT